MKSSWIDVAPAAEFGPGTARRLETDGARIAVINLAGEYWAIADVCTHDGSPLLDSGPGAEAFIHEGQIVCPRHGASFCIRTGAAGNPPAWQPLACFPVRVEQGMVQVQARPA